MRTTLTDVWDKGKAAVIWQEGVATSDAGEELWTTRSSIFVRGEGGWGGDRGTSEPVELPDRAPDAETTYAITPQQALLYRLCGDRNPLHSDPDFAKAAGFPAPILHGLCSYGIVLRELTTALLGGDATRVGGFAVKFTGVVYPGRDDPGPRLAGGRPDRRRGHRRRRRARRRTRARRRRPHARLTNPSTSSTNRSGSSTHGKWPAPSWTTSSACGNNAATSAITRGGLPVSKPAGQHEHRHVQRRQRGAGGLRVEGPLGAVGHRRLVVAALVHPGLVGAGPRRPTGRT